MAVELASGYVSILPSLKGFGKDLARELGQELDGLDVGAEGAGDSAGGGFASGFGGAAKAGLAAVAIAAAAVFAKGFANALDVEKANDKLAAQLGLPPDEAERLGKIAGDLYANAYGESIGEVNEALRAGLQNGLLPEDATNEQIERVTAKALDLSAAFDQDVGESAKAAGQLIRTGLAADADEALDILTRGFQQGGDKADDLLDTVGEYSTLFRNVGLDGEAAIGLLTQGLGAGARDADKVADAIKEFSIRAVDGSEATAEGFQAIGLNAEEMARRIAGGGEDSAAALDETLDRLRAIEDPVARSQAAVALFGTQAEDLGDALYALDPSQAVARLGDVEGAAERMGETLNDNTATKIESFKRKGLQRLTDFIGGTVIPAIEDLAEWLGPVIEDAGELAREGLAAVSEWWDENGPGIIAAAMGVRDAVLDFANRVNETLGPIWEQIAATVVPLVQDIATSITEGFGNVQAWVDENWPKIQETVETVMAAVSAVIDAQLAVIQFVWDAVGENLLGIVERVWNTIRDVIGGLMRAIGGIIETVMALITGDWGAAWDGIKNVVGGVWDAIWSIIDGAVGIIWELLQGFGQLIWDLLAIPFGAAKDFIRDRIDDVVGFVTGLPGRIGDIGRAIADAVVGGLKAAWNAAAGGINDLIPNEIGVGIGPSIDVPDNPLPILHDGGIVPGRPGEEVLTVLEAGERVLSRQELAGGMSANAALDGRPIEVLIPLDCEVIARQLVPHVRAYERSYA